MCRAAETTRAQAKELRRGETIVHAIHKEQRQKKTFTFSLNVVSVEAVTSQNPALHLGNSLTTVERAITMLNVAKRLPGRKFTQLKEKRMSLL